MKAIIYLLTVHLAFCRADGGFLFAASGFYGGLGVDKYYKYKDLKFKDVLVDDGIGGLAIRPTFYPYKGLKFKDVVVGKGIGTLPIRPTIYDDYGGYEINRDDDEQLFEVGNESRHSGRGVYVGHGNQVGFEEQQKVKAIKSVLDEGGRDVFNGFDGHGSGRYANPKVKIMEVIEDEDESDNPGGFVAHDTHGGHSGHNQHSKQKTIKVIHVEDETDDHDAHTGGHAQQEFETIKVIHTKGGGRSAHNGHGDRAAIDGYGRNNGQQEIKTIQVIHNEGGYADQAGFGAQRTHADHFPRDNPGFVAHSAHADHFPRDQRGEIQTIKIIQDGNASNGRHSGFAGRANGGYAEYDGNGGRQDIRIIKVIHGEDGNSGRGAFRGQSGYEKLVSHGGYGGFSGTGSSH